MPERATGTEKLSQTGVYMRIGILLYSDSGDIDGALDRSEMKPRYLKSLDANHGQIVKHLRKHGVFVQDMSDAGKVPDLLLSYRGQNRWCEIKIPGREARYTADQLKTISETPMDAAFIDSQETALEYAINGTGRLTVRQKDAIAGLLIRNPGKKAFTVKQIEEIL